MTTATVTEIWELPAPAKTDDIRVEFSLTLGQFYAMQGAGVEINNPYRENGFVVVTFSNIGDIKSKLTSYAAKTDTQRGEKAIVTRTIKEMTERLEGALRYANRDRNDALETARKLVAEAELEFSAPNKSWTFEGGDWKHTLRARLVGATDSLRGNYHSYAYFYMSDRIEARLDIDETGARVFYKTNGARFETLTEAKKYIETQHAEEFEEYKTDRTERIAQAKEMLTREELN
jgi:hypothetical protein